MGRVGYRTTDGTAQWEEWGTGHLMEQLNGKSEVQDNLWNSFMGRVGYRTTDGTV